MFLKQQWGPIPVPSGLYLDIVFHVWVFYNPKIWGKVRQGTSGRGCIRILYEHTSQQASLWFSSFEQGKSYQGKWASRQLPSSNLKGVSCTCCYHSLIFHPSTVLSASPISLDMFNLCLKYVMLFCFKLCSYSYLVPYLIVL